MEICLLIVEWNIPNTKFTHGVYIWGLALLTYQSESNAFYSFKIRKTL